ncbi:hypothetical protein E2C01_049765 [Portunus trituberculatus]|uniref:Uncharacterized protein n=1 Tax=Portunus trituberculatus TaxID=210409 RepID=A0A5B7G6G5_PORTR|nr:hypothetical protein [Portunus trituberculatus]
MNFVLLNEERDRVSLCLKYDGAGTGGKFTLLRWVPGAALDTCGGSVGDCVLTRHADEVQRVRRERLWCVVM